MASDLMTKHLADSSQRCSSSTDYPSQRPTSGALPTYRLWKSLSETQASRTSPIALAVEKAPDHWKIQVWNAMASGSGIARAADYLRNNVRSVEKVSRDCGWDVGNVVMADIKLVCGRSTVCLSPFTCSHQTRLMSVQWRNHLRRILATRQIMDYRQYQATRHVITCLFTATARRMTRRLGSRSVDADPTKLLVRETSDAIQLWDGRAAREGVGVNVGSSLYIGSRRIDEAGAVQATSCKMLICEKTKASSSTGS